MAILRHTRTTLHLCTEASLGRQLQAVQENVLIFFFLFEIGLRHTAIPLHFFTHVHVCLYVLIMYVGGNSKAHSYNPTPLYHCACVFLCTYMYVHVNSRQHSCTPTPFYLWMSMTILRSTTTPLHLGLCTLVHLCPYVPMYVHGNFNTHFCTPTPLYSCPCT